MYFTYYPHLPEKLTIIYKVYKISLPTERSNMAVTENTTSKYAQTDQENVAALCLVAQSRPTLCDPMDSDPPGSSVHGISQARVLEWVAISFSMQRADSL